MRKSTRGIKINDKNEDEIELLVRLISPRIGDVDFGNSNVDKFLSKKRNAAWMEIHRDFNASPKCVARTSLKRLRGLWTVLKVRMRRERLRTPPNKALTDRFSEAIERIILNFARTGRGTKRIFIAPPTIKSKLSTKSTVEESNAEAERKRERPRNAAAPSRNLSSASVLDTPSVDVATELKRQTSPCYGQSVNFKGVGSRHEQEVDGTPNSLEQADLRKFAVSHPVQQQSGLQIQSLSEIEKLFHETKKKTVEMLTYCAAEVYETKMNLTSLTEEKTAAVLKTLQEREGELHSARVRAEELSIQLLAELHEVKMQTAEAERREAMIKEKLIELTFQKTWLELQEFQGKVQGCIKS